MIDLRRKFCSNPYPENPEQAQEIIMKWAKVHPVKTNVDKFEEVFGFEVKDLNKCKLVLEDKGCTNPYGRCEDCENHMSKFWQQEYKERNNE